jgi:hypothetical protein
MRHDTPFHRRMPGVRLAVRWLNQAHGAATDQAAEVAAALGELPVEPPE